MTGGDEQSAYPAGTGGNPFAAIFSKKKMFY